MEDLTLDMLDLEKIFGVLGGTARDIVIYWCFVFWMKKHGLFANENFDLFGVWKSFNCFYVAHFWHYSSNISRS